MISPALAGVFGVVFGAIIGSYLATLALRWPQGKSALAGRSRCDECGQTLRWFELVPLVSYLARGGQCARCGARIDPVHPAMELGAAAIGGLSFFLYPSFYGLAGAVFGWALLLLAVLDIRHFWLPDRVTLPLLLTGLGVAWLLGTPPIADAAIGAGAGFLILFLIGLAYRAVRGRDGIGGGDSKLLAAIGAWLGWQILPLVILLASATGLLVVLIHSISGQSTATTDRLPFGAFLAVTTWPLWLARDVLAVIFPGV